MPADGIERLSLTALNIDPALLPSLVPSSGVLGQASVLPGAPPIASLCGDQQASLVGQGLLCSPGEAKATFGTGGMLDCSLELDETELFAPRIPGRSQSLPGKTKTICIGASKRSC